MKFKRNIPGRQSGGWNVSAACYCEEAGTQGFGQKLERLQGCYGWSSSPGVAALDCEADPWVRRSGCYLTSLDTPGCSVGCQGRRESHQISSVCFLSDTATQEFQ